jgi:hypothetical protein
MDIARTTAERRHRDTKKHEQAEGENTMHRMEMKDTTLSTLRARAS